MSRFYVGQRVRVIGAAASTHLIGKEALIVAVNVESWCAIKQQRYHGCETNLMSISGRSFVAETCWLEPITPEGMESLEETLALWRPEGVAA